MTTSPKPSPSARRCRSKWTGRRLGPPSRPAREANPAGHTVWFQWTAPASVPVRVDTCDYRVVSGPGNTGLFVYTGGSIPTLVLVGVSDFGCKVSFERSRGRPTGSNSTASSTAKANFTLKMFEETPPGKRRLRERCDGRARAAGLASPARPFPRASRPASRTMPATMKPTSRPTTRSGTAGPPTRASRSGSGSATPDFGARVGVYTGAVVNALTRVTTSVPLFSFPYCSLRFEAAAGHRYRIAVSGGGEEKEGEFTLDVHPFSPPANDDFADAASIGPDLPIAVDGTTIDSGVEMQEPDHSQFEEGPAFESVWYSWTPSPAGWSGSAPAGPRSQPSRRLHRDASRRASAVATGEGGCGQQSGHRFDLEVQAGTRYLIAVDGAFPERRGPVHPPSSIPSPSRPARRRPLPRRPFQLELLTEAGAEEVPEARSKKRARRRCVHRARRKAQSLSA